MDYPIEDLFLLLDQSQFGRLILALVSAICTIILVVVQLKKYRLQKQEKKEGDFLKYRLANYREGRFSDGTKFESVVDEYSYDKNTGRLVVVGTKDLQELVQSSADCALNKVLDKLGIDALTLQQLPTDKVTDVDDIIDMSHQYQDDLDYLREQSTEILEIRKRYNIPVTMSETEMFEFISAQKVKLDASIEENKKQSEVKKSEETKIE